MIHKEIEVYVDDVIIKSKRSTDHIADLRKFFNRLRRYNLKLNPTKCAFGVPAGKLLGFIICRRGIELDLSKVKEIQDLPPPKNKKDVTSFLGRLNYISRSIEQSTVICELIFKMLRKDAATSWTEECQKAFDKIKEYLSKPPILDPPEPGRPLLLYLSILDGAFGCVLGKHDETGRKEQTIYYLSKKFTPYEAWYSLLERTCCALTWIAQKFALLLCIHYISHIEDGSTEIYLSEAHAYGAANFKGVGIRAVLVSETDHHYPVSTKLRFPCTNNMAEYEACILGLRLAIDMNVQELLVIGDSDLLVHQIKHKNSTAYRLQMNGAVEAANKNIKKILRKMVDNYKQWHKKLLFALLGYRTAIRTSTGETPYLLVYGTKSVIPAEVEVPSLRIIQETEFSDEEWVQSRYEQLDLIDGKRMNAVCHGQLYHNRMARAFNKRVRPRQFTPR
ncbi:uncharacterized protein [Nicotiana tomentosiformis]|uniref:uncharacterized protein n=1 Tax=Nicotiana tomentosiformis TaxID=4098 RepID=UPI00388C954C